MILGLRAVTRRRFATGAWSDGRFTSGTSTDTSIAMSVQPMTDRELQTLAEAERAQEVLKGYTTADVRTLDDQASPQVLADHIVITGDHAGTYEVRAVVEQTAILPHKRVRLMRLLEADG